MSDSFARNILNYFAAYTETRFRFGSKLPYTWSNDFGTLDFSVYPEFEERLLESVASLSEVDFSVKQGEFTVELDGEKTKSALREMVKDYLTPTQLEEVHAEQRDRLKDLELEEEELEARILAESIRSCNLELRKLFLQTLTQLQDEKIDELKGTYRFEHPPISTFNSNIPAM